MLVIEKLGNPEVYKYKIEYLLSYFLEITVNMLEYFLPFNIILLIENFT